MKVLTILATLAAVSAFGGTDESAAFAEKRARNELLAARFAPSCAQLRVFFKLDKQGESPSCSLRYYCPNCKDYHTGSVESYLRDERPLEGAAFAIAPNRFLVQDLHLLDGWVDRMEIVFGGKVYAAKPVVRYPKEEAVEVETSEPVTGVKPLAFSKRIDFMSDGDGVFFYSTKDKGLAVCGMRPNTTASFVRYGDLGKDVFSVVANTIAVNASNEAVSVAFRTQIVEDGKAFVPPSEWAREPADAFGKRWESLEKTMSQSLVPLYVHLDDEENRKDGYSRRYRSYREDSESTDIDLVGAILPDGEVIAQLNLDASKMSEIDKIEAILADGKRVPLDFVGALSEVKLAVFRFADGKTPDGLRPLTFDARRPETHFLEPAFVMMTDNFNGKTKSKLVYSPIEQFEAGRGGECLPVPMGSGFGYRNNGLPMLVYPDGTVGGLGANYRHPARYSGSMELVSAEKLGTYLTDRDFDPQFALRKGKDRVRIAWIGVETQRITEELAREKKAMALLASAQTSGALVTRIWPDSPAAKAGLAVGDILLNARLVKSHATQDLEDTDAGEEFDWGAFFGMSIGGDEDGDFSAGFDGLSPWPNVERGVNRTFTAFGIGKKVVVAYVRNGERREAEMTLAQAPVHYQTAKRIKNKDLGIIVSDMTFEVRGYFKFAEDAPGVVVVKVQPGNPAAIGGLRPLEIITHVNNEPVTSAKDFARKVKGKKDLTFAVRRLAATRVVRIELKK